MKDEFNSGEFPSLPPEKFEQPRGLNENPVIQTSLIATISATATYVFAPDLFNLPVGSSQNEYAALLAGGAAIALSNLHLAKDLCWVRREKIDQQPLEIAKGAGGGMLAGTAIASLTPQILISVIDGGIMLFSTIVGAAFAKATIDRRTTKYCPHCGRKGKCPQKVCRACHRVFWLSSDDPDCHRKLTLTWYELVSFLDRQGLNYLDAEFLLGRYDREWKSFRAQDGLRIDCQSFMQWFHNSKDDVLKCIGRGGMEIGPNPEPKSFQDIDRYLIDKEL